MDEQIVQLCWIIEGFDFCNNNYIRRMISHLEPLKTRIIMDMRSCRDSHRYLPRSVCECHELGNKIYLIDRILNSLDHIHNRRNIDLIIRNPPSPPSSSSSEDDLPPVQNNE